MKKLVSFVFLLCLMSATTANAQKVSVYPVPQDVVWGENVAFANSVGFVVNGEESADVDAVALLKKNFNIGNDGVALVIGERGDDAVTEYESLIPEKAEGYYLSVAADKVVIAGNDGSGTYYGVQTFIQLASQTNVMEVTIVDYPLVPERGLVEGYYGNPYSEADRMGLLEMFGRMKMNVYIYGPKDDDYHKKYWRENYPEELGKKITEYVNVAKANKIDFMWAIHPGEDIQWNDEDRTNIVNKLKAMCALGVRSFAVFWDDLWGDDGTHGDEQAELMNYIAQELEKDYPDVKPLTICPTQYNRGWANSVYLPALGTMMNKDIKIMWTGNSVVDMINKSDMEWINNQINRKAYIWLNYPVSDYCINHLLMGPTYGNDLDIADMLSGFVSNPMEYAEASKVSLFSIADYTWNMLAYDADASWEAAIEYIMPENKEAFRFFCENNVDLGVNTHGLRRTNESPEFVKAKNEYDANMAQGDEQAAFDAVGAQFNKFVTVAETLLAAEEAPALIAEIKPWLQSMRYLGLKGKCLIDMHDALLKEAPEDFINAYLEYKEYDEAQGALRSRDFAGSPRVATPVVATVHVEPFIKNLLGELVAEYRSSYDYRIDVFPALVLENGTYYIMHEGKYLTNSKPREAGTAPEFVAGKDTIRPQKQEWKITVDPATNRYKVINLEDNRYLNENGVFTVSDDTNPYDPVWHTYEILLLANGKYAIQNGGKAGENFWAVDGSRVVKSNSADVLPKNFIFDIVSLDGKKVDAVIDSDGVYYIMLDGKYLTNVNVGGSGGAPEFKEVESAEVAQEWNVSVDATGQYCYKITSNADGRYLNEYAVFGSENPYYSDWNTYLLTVRGDEVSVQLTQSAINKQGIRYWMPVDNKLDAKQVARSESYCLNFVKKSVESSVSIVDAENVVAVQRDGKIVAANGVKSMALYSVDGVLVAASECNELSIESVAKGLYLVELVSAAGKSTVKIHIK